MAEASWSDGTIFGSINILNVSQAPTTEFLNDLDGYLARHAQRQLDQEKHSAKYIPDIFVETQVTKNLARTFAHPLLFLPRTLDAARQISIPATNRFLDRAGLPQLPYPNIASYYDDYTLATIGRAANEISATFEPTISAIEMLRVEGRNDPSTLSIRPGCEPYHSENTYRLDMFGYGLSQKIDERRAELSAIAARIFILVGRAGQGKTNFVCDFVENFLFKHGIPCVYLTGRRLSSIAGQDLAETIRSLVFPDQTFFISRRSQDAVGTCRKAREAFCCNCRRTERTSPNPRFFGST